MILKICLENQYLQNRFGQPLPSLLLFVILIAYGIITKQGSNYVLIVMVLLAAVLAIFPAPNWRRLFPVW